MFPLPHNFTSLMPQLPFSCLPVQGAEVRTIFKEEEEEEKGVEGGGTVEVHETEMEVDEEEEEVERGK